MNVKKLQLINFRNYESETFSYSDGVNVVSGGNAQGKTNSAEAIFYLCAGYSPRAGRDKQVIRKGQEKASVEGIAEAAYGPVKVNIDFYSDNVKDVRVNDVKIARSGELLGNINSVFFNPSELRLIQDAPEDRRRFMDVSLSQLSRPYYYALQRYKKILSQRNTLLKDENKELVLDTLPVWDESLVKYGAKIIYERNAFIERLSPLCEEAYSDIAGGAENIKIEGEEKFKGEQDEIAAALKNALSQRAERDIELGYTSIGPHRDDLRIKVDGTDVKVYGSQGQQRTAAIALKLAETEIFKERYGEYPVLILDDAMSELDRKRREKLIARVKKMQTIITCTEPDCVPGYENFNNIRIRNGKIVKE